MKNTHRTKNIFRYTFESIFFSTLCDRIQSEKSYFFSFDLFKSHVYILKKIK